MYKSAVMIRWADHVVIIRAQTRLDVSSLKEKGRTHESGAETGDHGKVNGCFILVSGKRAAVTAPDVGGRGLGVSVGVVTAAHGVVNDSACDVAVLPLGVDDEGRP